MNLTDIYTKKKENVQRIYMYTHSHKHKHTPTDTQLV